MNLKTDVSKPIYSTDGNYKTVLNLMNYVAELQKRGKIMDMLVDKLHLKNDLQSLVEFCKFIYAVCPFVPHIGRQNVRTLNAMLADRRGNCVEYTTAIATFCKRFNVPCIIRAVSFSEPNKYTHVYAVVDGLPFDLVLGQEPPEKDFVMKLGITKKSCYHCDVVVN